MRYVWSLWGFVCPALFAALATASCAGNAFTNSQAIGGASEQGSAGASDHSRAGREAESTAGASSEGGVGASSNGGGAPALGDAGQSSDGGTSGAAQGEAGNAGNGDAGADSGTGWCAAHDGVEFNGHCYIDATVNSTSQQQAVATCAQLTADRKVSGHLLVLDSVEEQNFILRQFMLPFTDSSDAWLGLTCHELAEPDINACYCSQGCSQAVLTEKQKAWDWLGGASSSFGWINGNPNGGYRCAALAYNPDSTVWGWVDRPCDKVSFTGVAGHPHGYRTLCELELP